jgi:uncharacterized protein YhfF
MNEIEQYWDQFRKSRAILRHDIPERYDAAFYFGSSPESAFEIAELVLAGVKTATGSLVWRYQHEGRRLPQVGDLNIVTDGRRSPLCITQTIEVRILPYDQVDAQFAYDGGEGDRSLASWRKIYWDFILRECEIFGKEPVEDVPLVCERFRVIYKEPLR